MKQAASEPRLVQGAFLADFASLKNVGAWTGALEQICVSTSNHVQMISLLLLQVHNLANEVRKHLDGQKLSALVNNAGVYQTKHEKSLEGFEMTWSVNVASVCNA